MKLEVDLTPELNDFVDQEVASGRFASRAEVLCHAVDALKRELNEERESVQAILEGHEQHRAGEGMSVDDAFSMLFRDLSLI